MGCSDQEIQLRVRSRFGDECFILTDFKDPGYRTVRIIQIPEIHAFGGTGCHTGGFQTLFDPVDTKGTLVHMPSGMRIACIVRTGSNTGPATDALVLGYQHNSPV
jgi:hypothetical protein